MLRTLVGLRVAGASVILVIQGRSTQAPVVAIAERAVGLVGDQPHW